MVCLGQRSFVKFGYNFVSAISVFPINSPRLVWPNQSQHQIISMSMKEMSVVKLSIYNSLYLK